MKIQFDVVRDKILGCWSGKNIGGILGAPFEGKRQVNNVDFYTQDLSKGLPPNDDLDLQLVWLAAVEKYGDRVNAAILSDYWLSYIVPDWNEYGTGKRNLTAGMLPPLSGSVNNSYAESCGCFIRSEIWACLCPGHPEKAVRYAYEDAIVDHAGEGVYGEVFCAAVESAAFVESDKNKLIDIGLSYIPQNCLLAKGINLVRECYKNGLTYLEARERLMNEVPGSFGVQGTKRGITEDFPVNPGCDAPNNISIAVIGWLYGEDDFGKSLCIAVNCGEDTDCTAATLGAILGIVHGNSGLPEKWLAPIGGAIVTGCVNKTFLLIVPENVEELTDRVLRQMPYFLGEKSLCGKCDGDYWCDVLSGMDVEAAENLYCENEHYAYEGLDSGESDAKMEKLLKCTPSCVRFDFTVFNAVLDYMGEPYIKSGEERKIKLVLKDNKFSGKQLWADVKLYLPEGVICKQGTAFSVPIERWYLKQTEMEFDLFAENLPSGRIEFLIDISVSGRPSYGVVKGILYASV